MADRLAVVRAALPSGYTLDRQLKAGGQGAVFCGTLNGFPVALKLFGVIELERLKREIQLLQTVQCPYLVKLLDFQMLTIQGTPVPMAAYEFVDGGDLREVVTDPSAQVTESELARIGHDVGTAVEALWSHRIVHRDIKPDNIVRSKSDGRYVLVDVGFAQHLDLSTITAAAGQPGTNGYRSPEQTGGRRRLTIHSDTFSLGVTVYEVAAKAHPWNRNHLDMLRSPHKPLVSHRNDLSPPFHSLIAQMLQRTPARRPTDPAQRFSQLRGP